VSRVLTTARRPDGHRLETLRFTAASDYQRQLGEQRTEPNRAAASRHIRQPARYRVASLSCCNFAAARVPGAV